MPPSWADHSADRWVCRRCGNQFVRLRPNDMRQQTIAEILRACRADFSIADDGRETVVWFGDGPPMTLWEPGLNRCHIYLTLSAQSCLPQFRYQLAHEIFHRVCTLPATFHWAHELLAVEFSFRSAEAWLASSPSFRSLFGPYFAVQRARHVIDAPHCQLPRVLAFDGRGADYPDHLYAAVDVIAQELLGSLTWAELKSLAHHWSGTRPSVAGWLASLPEPKRLEAQVVLTAVSSPT